MSRELEQYAFEARRAGASYREIPALILQKHGIKISPSGCYKAVNRVLLEMTTQTAEVAETVRGMELIRLDRLQFQMWTQAMNGHQGATEKVLKIMERRARLLGLDAPVQSDMKLTGTLSIGLVDEIIAAATKPADEPPTPPVEAGDV